LWKIAMRTMRIVNVIPHPHSGESIWDGEPSIAVNPRNVAEMVITTQGTPTEDPGRQGPKGSIFFSLDGGETWSLGHIIPDKGQGDQSPCFASTSNELYIAVLPKGSLFHGEMDVIRISGSAAPPVVAFMMESRKQNIDQPWVVATTVVGGLDAGKDRLYVGYRLLAGHGGSDDDESDEVGSAMIDICLDASSATPVFTHVRLDPRSKLDGYPVRPVVHSDGTVYVAYESVTSVSPDRRFWTVDLVVARDDEWASGASTAPFTALRDPGDNEAGRIVARGVLIPTGGSLGGVRLGNDLSIAVDPTNSDVVYLVWCDTATAAGVYTLRLLRSNNRGSHWSSAGLSPIENATLVCLAINDRGRVGLLYQKSVAGLMETHFQTTADGASWDDTLLARTEPTTGFSGDYARIVAAGSGFYGVFPAMNSPWPTNFFPNGGGTFNYQRNVDYKGHLISRHGDSIIRPSVDPFFFKILDVD